MDGLSSGQCSGGDWYSSARVTRLPSTLTTTPLLYSRHSLVQCGVPCCSAPTTQILSDIGASTLQGERGRCRGRRYGGGYQRRRMALEESSKCRAADRILDVRKLRTKRRQVVIRSAVLTQRRKQRAPLA